MFHDPDSGLFHMLTTARTVHGPMDGRGAIGHAVSADLLNWEVRPPVAAPGEFAQLEVPQLVHVGGQWRILFSASATDHSATRLTRHGVEAEGGTHYLSSSSPLGPYQVEEGPFLVGDPYGSHYGGRLLEHGGQWLLFTWLSRGEDGSFAGELCDPLPVTVRGNGSLAVALPDQESARRLHRGLRQRP